MKKFKVWVSAARPRTLPLSIAGILTGSGLALREGEFDAVIFIFALLTTLGFQILSNFANDYGDGIKGTDNEERLGPTRALQSGAISDREMKKAMIWTSGITLVFALILIFSAFEASQIGYVFLFLILGIASILAAIKYTVGKSAYGYQGLGDLFVFLFFGLLGVVGSYFLYTHHLNILVWIPAGVVGLLSMAVLNLNNMRDINSDKKSDKITLAVKLGRKKSKFYHAALIGLSAFLTGIYIGLDYHPFLFLLYIPIIILIYHLKIVYKTVNPKDLDSEMKKVALSTVAYALLYLLTGLF